MWYNSDQWHIGGHLWNRISSQKISRRVLPFILPFVYLKPDLKPRSAADTENMREKDKSRDARRVVRTLNRLFGSKVVQNQTTALVNENNKSILSEFYRFDLLIIFQKFVLLSLPAATGLTFFFLMNNKYVLLKNILYLATLSLNCGRQHLCHCMQDLHCCGAWT